MGQGSRSEVEPPGGSSRTGLARAEHDAPLSRVAEGVGSPVSAVIPQPVRLGPTRGRVARSSNAAPAEPDDQGLHPSLYTLAVEVDDDVVLLMHQPRGSVDRLPLGLADQVMKRPDSLSEEAITYFVERGYLTYATAAEEESGLVALVRELEDGRREMREAPLFSFVTTYSCNLACSYCFQANTGVRESEERRMSVEAARRFLKVVEAAPRHPDRAVVELFGGEPLLPTLRPVVEEIVLAVEQWGYVTRATTNGTGLSAYLDLLGPTRIAELQISLDGTAEYHDKRRIGLAGRPTFSQIWANLREAIDRGTKVMIRSNLDRRNVAGFVGLVEFVEREGLLGHPLCEIHYVDVQPDPIAPDFGSDVTLSLGEIERYLQAESDGHPVLKRVAAPHEIGTFDEWLASNFQNPQTRHCGAVTNNVYFSPDGLVYSCHETAGRPEFAIGSVEGDEIRYNSNAENWRSRRVDNLPQCRRCAYALTCSGGCAARTDILNEPHQSYCDGFDAKFRSILRRQYQAAQSADIQVTEGR